MNNMPKVNLTSRAFKANPYPFYAQLRAEAPVYPVILPDKQRAWLITRYDDVLRVLKDDQCFVKNPRHAKTPEQLKKLPWVPPMFRPLSSNMLDSDWEVHTRLRSLIHKAFTPRLIEAMRSRVESLAGKLLAAAEQRGQMDLIADYALPIPLTIISEMLGVAAQDQGKFHSWSKRVLSAQASSYAMLVALPSMLKMMGFLRRLIAEKRAHPSDDLTSALIQVEEAGEQLNADELLAMLLVLMFAGHETTVNLIGSGSLALLEHPDQRRRLRQQPELIKTAIEELVRFVNPVEQATERYAREEVTLQGVIIPRGELVLAALASANRDETVFADPDRLDITRENNKHLAFGMGVHYCAGAPLARLEGQIAIQMLVQRLPGLRLGIAPDALRWRPGLTVRGLEALPVAL